MVKNNIILLLALCFLNSCYSQKERDLWYNSPSYYDTTNKKLYITSSINDSIFKKEITLFINKYIANTSLDKEEVAINVNIQSLNEGSVKYTISYLTEYYNKISYKDIQQISLVENRIVFINYQNVKGFYVKKEVFFELLKDRFPKEYNYLKDSYKKYKEEGDDIYPIIIETLEHDLPYWEIIINKKGLIQKKESKSF